MFVYNHFRLKIPVFSFWFLNSSAICVWYLLYLSIMDILLNLFSPWFLSVATLLLTTTLYCFVPPSKTFYVRCFAPAKIDVWYSVNEFFCDIFVAKFCFSTSLHLHFFVLVTAVFKFPSWCFLHTSVNTILCSSSSNALFQLPTCILPFCHS